MKKVWTLCFPATLLFLLPVSLEAQARQPADPVFSRADTLRGALRPERTAYDVLYYQLNVFMNPEVRQLVGYVEIQFEALDDFETLQIDLYRNMNIQKIVFQGRELSYKRDEDAVFVHFPKVERGTRSQFSVYYDGFPTVAANAPWDGGFVWGTDKNQKPWVGVACQGAGASLWWPCKDHLSDEPDSMEIRIILPDTLVAVSNGRLVARESAGSGYARYTWKVSYPINTYNVTLNAGDYVHFSDKYSGDTGPLDLDYYVLPYNLDKARTHFRQVHGVLDAFGQYFGPYPFTRDGYKLVETPYLGMEHQSAIAYGNLYRRGYLGGGIPKDMHFDYIILHETGHEYFGNAISVSDLADMWVHESFTTYMEALYVEKELGPEAALRYQQNQKNWIVNDRPIVGQRGINWGKSMLSTDQYYKGSWILRTLREVLDDDKLWFATLKDLYETFRYQIVITEDIISFLEQRTGHDLYPFFRQYLYHKDLPVFSYKLDRDDMGWRLSYALQSSVPDLQMPFDIQAGNASMKILAGPQERTLYLPLEKASELKLPADRVLVDFLARP